MLHHNILGGNYGTKGTNKRNDIRSQAVARPDKWDKIPNRGGRTLINGTGYDISLKSDETWLLNDPIAYGVAATCNFVSNGTQFIGITSRMAMFQMLAYIRSDGTYTDVFNLNTRRWVNQAYRTLEFDEAPSGELLSWLEQNGTRI